MCIRDRLKSSGRTEEENTTSSHRHQGQLPHNGGQLGGQEAQKKLGNNGRDHDGIQHQCYHISGSLWGRGSLLLTLLLGSSSAPTDALLKDCDILRCGAVPGGLH
eukprot:TRINITY_DN51378_c0_g1_i1.p2 TRINITY_DN51378_c0_g1~~TRINITY_DN51378_c0_g1_i1.p2  ORF type:complete len:105 (-),score=12.96 TRINITY_DN51378_c0_g1_i1:1-315(-)